MGEIADMVLDGTLCEGCGSYMGGEGYGFPRYCSERCRRDRLGDDRYEARIPKANRYGVKDNPKIKKPGDPIRQGDMMGCPFCVRRVKVVGFGDHMLDQHRDKWPAEPTS